MVDLTMGTECVNCTVSHIGGHTIKLTVHRSEREVAIEISDVCMEMPSISVRARPQSHEFRWCLMGGKMNLSTTTTESRWLGLKLLCIAVLAVIRWLEHVRHVRDIGINRIIWI